uniref:Uncharacterized protein n=1 Tax=Salix viminalis TaxID=40686 RepID=A0A6N2KYP4_SALVM
MGEIEQIINFRVESQEDFCSGVFYNLAFSSTWLLIKPLGKPFLFLQKITYPAGGGSTAINHRPHFNIQGSVSR